MRLSVHMLTHCNPAESWEPKAELPSPSRFDHNRAVEVTSVNWQTKGAAAAASRVIVSYRWHGIMYVVHLVHSYFILHLSSCSDAGA